MSEIIDVDLVEVDQYIRKLEELCDLLADVKKRLQKAAIEAAPSMQDDSCKGVFLQISSEENNIEKQTNDILYQKEKLEKYSNIIKNSGGLLGAVECANVTVDFRRLDEFQNMLLTISKAAFNSIQEGTARYNQVIDKLIINISSLAEVIFSEKKALEALQSELTKYETDYAYYYDNNGERREYNPSETKIPSVLQKIASLKLEIAKHETQKSELERKKMDVEFKKGIYVSKQTSYQKLLDAAIRRSAEFFDIYISNLKEAKRYLD